MNEIIKNIGLQLGRKLIDLGVATLTSPRESHAETRIEQIDRTLETLESMPEVGQHWTTPPAASPESQKEASLATAATTTIQTEERSPGDVAEPSVSVSQEISSPGAVDDEYCVG